MPIAQIPPQYRPGFLKIRKLSGSDFDALLQTLQKSPTPAGLASVVSYVCEGVGGISKDDVEDILRALYSLYAFQSDEEAPRKTLVAELARAMQGLGEQSLPDSERAEFERRMNSLLSLPTLETSSKIDSLKLEYPNTYVDSRILTDIRPVFSKPDQEPVGFVVSHTLKVEYHKSTEHKEFYVTLDSDELKSMKEVLERAELKAASVKKLFKTASLSELS